MLFPDSHEVFQYLQCHTWRRCKSPATQVRHHHLCNRNQWLSLSLWPNFNLELSFKQQLVEHRISSPGQLAFAVGFEQARFSRDMQAVSLSRRRLLMEKSSSSECGGDGSGFRLREGGFSHKLQRAILHPPGSRWTGHDHTRSRKVIPELSDGYSTGPAVTQGLKEARETLSGRRIVC